MLLSSTIRKLIIVCNSIFSTLPLCIIIVINIHNLYSHFHLYYYTMKLKLTFYHSKDSGTERISFTFSCRVLCFIISYKLFQSWHTLSPFPLALPSLLFWKRNKEWWIYKKNNLTLQKKTQPINYSFKPTSSIATVTSLWETAVVSSPALPPLPSSSFREKKRNVIGWYKWGEINKLFHIFLY